MPPIFYTCNCLLYLTISILFPIAQCVGDEVLEWNGYPLQGRTFEEVYDIICESRADHEVEIVVSRPISDVGRPGASINPSGPPPPPPSSSAHGQLSQSQQRGGGNGGVSGGSGGGSNNNNNNSQRSMMGPSSTGTGGPSGGSGVSGSTGGHHLSHHQLLQRDRPAVTVTSPGDRHHQQSSSSWGKVQVKLWYDSTAQQLSVTIVCGYDLPPRPNGAPRNPYAKLFLLPDKRFVFCLFHSFIINTFLIAIAIIIFFFWRNLVKNRNDGRGHWRQHWSLDGIKHLSILTCVALSFVHVFSRSPSGTAIDSTPDALSEK